MASNSETIGDLIKSSTKSCYGQGEGYLTTRKENHVGDPDIVFVTCDDVFDTPTAQALVSDWVGASVLIAEFLPFAEVTSSQHRPRAEFLLVSTVDGKKRGLFPILGFDEGSLSHSEMRRWSAIHFHLKYLMTWSVIATNRKERFLRYCQQVGFFKESMPFRIVEVVESPVIGWPEGTESMSLRLPEAMEEILPRCKTTRSCAWCHGDTCEAESRLSYVYDHGWAGSAAIGHWQKKLLHAILGSLTLQFYRWIRLRFKPNELSLPAGEISDLIKKYLLIETYPDKVEDPQEEFILKERVQQKKKLQEEVKKVDFCSILRLPYHV